MKNIIALLAAVFLLSTVDAQTPAKSKGKQAITATDKKLSFFVVGDWGRCGIPHQVAVAGAMAHLGDSVKPSFIISVGDNFYPNGVASEYDHQWLSSFENVYHDYSLNCDWFVVLGNHDYRGNPDAEVAYGKLNRRWNMPARYYSQTFNEEDSANAVFIAFIDTDPLVKDYYTDPGYSAQVKTQDTAAQLKWLDKALAASHARWKLVAAHHPIYSSNKGPKANDTKDVNHALAKILLKNHVDMYIAGHEHNLSYTRPAIDGIPQFISGSGAEKHAATIDPDGGQFAASEYGFMYFVIKGKSATIKVLNEKEEELYTTIISK